MKFKRLLTLTLSATMLFSSLTVSAATSEEAVLPGTDTAQSSETLVTGKQGSTFLVRIPKTMNITINADGNMTDSYNVTVKGDISGTETVKVVPDTLFNLAADGKVAINTTVSQAKTTFKYDEIVTENVQVGGIAASGLTAGTWSGQFNFNVSIEDNKIEKAGLYDADGNMTKTWDELIDEGTLTVTNGELNSQYDTNNNVNPSADKLAGNLVISDSVKSIGDRVFRRCINLISVTIPDSITLIGEQAFTICTNLTSVIIPNSVTAIEEYTFSNCTSLTSVIIPDNVTSIGKAAFNNCTNLISAIIPNSVTTIEKWEGIHLVIVEI